MPATEGQTPRQPVVDHVFVNENIEESAETDSRNEKRGDGRDRL